MTKAYNTEIISVGTELLLGHVTNTDARDISELLSKIGINVLYHTVVGDNPRRLKQCVERAKERSDIIITTGGLGPTCDDLTKQVLAEAFGLELVADKAEMDGLYDYISRGRVLTENNYTQGMLPEGCTVFHNLWGTAPGCAFEKDGKTVIMMPGPPEECVPMFKAYGMPYLQKLSGAHIVSHTVNIFGMGESTVDSIFAQEMNAMTNPSMAPYAKECDCLLKITAKAATVAQAEAMIEPVMREVKEKLGDVVYGTDVDCVEEALIKLCRGRELHRRLYSQAFYRPARGQPLFQGRHGHLHQRGQGSSSGHRPGPHRGKGGGELRGGQGHGGKLPAHPGQRRGPGSHGPCRPRRGRHP